MTPLNIRMDGAANVQGANVVRFPKLCQGAPYSYGLKVRLEDDSYVVWDAVDIRWRIKLRPADTDDLFTLLKSEGNFEVDEETLTFKIKASDWEEVNLPTSTNHLEMDVPFSFVVEFLDEDGIVTERFAHGSGLITVSLGF